MVELARALMASGWLAPNHEWPSTPTTLQPGEDLLPMLADAAQCSASLAEHTKQPIERIAKDTQRDHYLNAVDAKAYGLVDEILERPPKEKKK